MRRGKVVGDILDKDAFALETCVNLTPNTETWRLQTIEQIKTCSSQKNSCFNDLLRHNVNCAFYQKLKTHHAKRALPPCDASHKAAEPD